jgi:hypothetical protein
MSGSPGIDYVKLPGVPIPVVTTIRGSTIVGGHMIMTRSSIAKTWNVRRIACDRGTESAEAKYTLEIRRRSRMTFNPRVFVSRSNGIGTMLMAAPSGNVHH